MSKIKIHKKLKIKNLKLTKMRLRNKIKQKVYHKLKIMDYGT